MSIRHEHTPTPWLSSQTGVIYTQNEDNHIEHICHVVVNATKRKETKANIKTIRYSAEMLEVLSELVMLKEYKDKNGKDMHYVVEQPKAWKKAKELLIKLNS